MNIQEKNINLIERYLDGSLDADEKASFEKSLEANIELKEAFHDRKKLKEIWIDADEFSKTKARIKTVLSKENKQSKTRRLWYVVSVAASVIILLGSYYFINQNQQENDFETPVLITKDTQPPNNQLQIDQPTTYAKRGSLSVVKLISPVKKQVVSSDVKIVFHWTSSLKQLDTLCIYSSINEEMMLQYPISLSDSIKKIHVASLEPGLYYWKIASQNDKGEFIIK